MPLLIVDLVLSIRLHAKGNDPAGVSDFAGALPDHYSDRASRRWYRHYRLAALRGLFSGPRHAMQWRILHIVHIRLLGLICVCPRWVGSNYIN